MSTDLRFALQYNFPGGSAPALAVVKTQLPGAEKKRGALIYKGNVLMFGKGPFHGEDGEFDLEISVFPLTEVSREHQRLLCQEVHAVLAGIAGNVDVLCDDELMK